MGQKLGGSTTFWGRGAASLSDTMSLGLRPTSLPSGILIHPAIWPQQIWAENWGGLCPFGGGGAGSPSGTMWPGLRRTSMPSRILIHPAIWPQQIWAENWGLRTILWEGELGPHLRRCGQGAGSPSKTMWPGQVSPWSIQPFGHSTPTSQTDRTDNGLIA